MCFGGFCDEFRSEQPNLRMPFSTTNKPATPWRNASRDYHFTHEVSSELTVKRYALSLKCRSAISARSLWRVLQEVPVRSSRSVLPDRNEILRISSVLARKVTGIGPRKAVSLGPKGSGFAGRVHATEAGKEPPEGCDPPNHP